MACLFTLTGRYSRGTRATSLQKECLRMNRSSMPQLRLVFIFLLDQDHISTPRFLGEDIQYGYSVIQALSGLTRQRIWMQQITMLHT